MHNPGAAVIVGVAPRVAGEIDRGVSAAMVGAVPGEHLAPTGVQTRHPHRVLDGIRARVGEEHMVEVTGSALGNKPRGLGTSSVGMLRRDRA